MELKVKREDLTNSLQLHDIVFAAIEANDANLLLEMMYNVKPDSSKSLQDDVFLNASIELKNKMRKLVELEGPVKFENYDLNSEPKHTPEFIKRAFNKKEPVTLHLDGSSFYHLEKSILDTKDANVMLGFAHKYEVNDAMFLKHLSQLGEIYEKAYRRDVLNDYRYQKDELQLYM